MGARDFLRNNWPGVVIAVTAAAIACAAVIMVRSMPPRTIVMATGSEGGAYQEFGKRYRTELAGADARVRLVPTAGSLENLALRLDPHSGVSAALIQGGTLTEANSSELESLGTVFYEPLWQFRRRGLAGEGLAGLRFLEDELEAPGGERRRQDGGAARTP